MRSFAAARVGDKTSHGDALSRKFGSPNVWIGRQRAWRAFADVHVCSKSDGVKAHVGGVVIDGSSKVFINALPAARQGDLIVEIGPPNSIAEGFAKVEIKG